MKKLMWIATGGTICCVHSENGLEPAADEQQMHKMFEAMDIKSETVFSCLMNIDSTDISITDMANIGKAVNDAILAGFSGIVITHGTDTMAYTAAFLEKMLENSPVPVIITGAQRPFFTTGSDGPENLKNAFTAASDNRFNGVYLIFGDKIIKGGKAHKEYTRSDNAFISCDEYAANIKNGMLSDITVSPSSEDYHFNDSFCHEIALIKITPFTTPDYIKSIASHGCKGLVIEGYGTGGIPSVLLESIRHLIDCGIRVMLISQCFYEGVDMNIYGVGRNAADTGIFSGGNMCAEAAVAHMAFSITDK